MIIAAEVITRAVEERPWTTASYGSLVSFHCSPGSALKSDLHSVAKEGDDTQSY